MGNLEGCGLTPAILSFQKWAMFIDSYIAMPIYFTVGLSGSIILLLTFYKQSKKESAYSYQVTLTLSKTLEIFNFSLFIMTYKWCAGVETPTGCTWFMKNYVLMFYTSHISGPVFNCLIVISLLLAAAMSADRVFIMLYPNRYNTINHKKHHLIATVICILIGILTSAYEPNRWRIIAPPSGYPKENETYIIQFNEQYLATFFAKFSANFRSALRIAVLIIIIVLNIIMIILYRRRNKKVAQMIPDTAQEKSRRERERTLLILSVYQAIIGVFSETPHSAYQISYAASPTFSRCFGIVVAPIADMAIEITDTLDFFVVLAINRKMRKMVYEALPCFRAV